MKHARVDAYTIISEYARLQSMLCRALEDKFQVELDRDSRNGSLTIEDGYWEFQKHGAGFQFTCIPSGYVVDAHVCWSTHSEAIDASRLMWYLESKEIFEIWHEGISYDASEERTLEKLIGELCLKKLLHPVLCEYSKVYILR